MVAAASLLGGLGSAPALADTLTVDFDSGPAIGAAVNDDYLASGFVRWIGSDAGFRPHRRSVGVQARSGTTVADVGASVCFVDTGDAGGCEFTNGGTYARMSRTAGSVTLYAGLFAARTGIGARLKAYNASGTLIATGPTVPISGPGTSGAAGGVGGVGGVVSAAGLSGRAGLATVFKTPVTVTRSAGDIAAFQLEAVDVANPDASASSLGADIGFDDLTFEYPAGTLPDLSINTPSQTAVLNGQSTDVPISLTRINGSSGPVELSATGLPDGVTATFTPNPVTTVLDSAVMRLTASGSAPRVDNLANVTVTGDPLANANVAPGVRVASIGVRVAAPFSVTSASQSVPLASCSTTDIPIVVARDQAFTGTVALSIDALPSGVTAEILPDATITPGGGFNAARTVRVGVAGTAPIATTLTVRGTSTTAPTSTKVLSLIRGKLTAELAADTGTLSTPQFTKPGTTATVTGSGFCAGTTVFAGNHSVAVPTTVAPDGKSLTFQTPRTATSGVLEVEQPGSSGLGQLGSAVAGTIRVDSFRNLYGFQFTNPSYQYLSYGELTDAFGSDDMFVTFNPCWPFGTCRINTGVPDPVSYLTWGVLNIALRSSGGHCFGITRAAHQMRVGKVLASRFEAGANHPIDLPSQAGPGGGLEGYLDGQHALQASTEFLSKYARRDDTVAGQLATLHSELAANRTPIVTMHHPSGLFGEGHAVVAYDEQVVPGGLDIYVYDSNRPTNAGGDPGGAEASVIHVTQSNQRWSFDLGSEVWTGGSDGNLFITPQSTIPDDPTLVGLSALDDLPAMIFGADGGSAHATAATPGAAAIPVLDSQGPTNSAGFLIGEKKGGALSTTVVGDKAGTYSTTVTGSGFSAAVTDVATGAGVQDVTGGDASAREITFQSGQDRSLEVSLAGTPVGGAAARAGDTSSGGTSQAATISTHASKGGTDSGGLTKGGTLAYEHAGKPTTAQFTLTATRTNGGPVVFTSPRVSVGDGDRLTASPRGADMKTVALTIKTKSGRTKRRTLRNQTRPPAKLRLASLKVLKAKGGVRTAELRTTIAGLTETAALGVVIKVKRGGKTIATHPLAEPTITNGARSFAWKLPKLAKGSYTLTANVRLAVGGAKPGSVSARKLTRARIG